MASKSRLRNALGSLGDTLTTRFNQSPDQLTDQWLGVMGETAAIARRVGAWNGLPDESGDFDPVIADLDAATHAIVGAIDARESGEIAEALEEAGQALSLLGALLDG